MIEQRLYLCPNCYEKEEPTNARPLRILDARFGDSGYVPSHAEVAHLRGVLEEEEKELARYQDEISALRRKLERLEDGERHLKSNVEWCRSGISAQRRIPLEIWELVFSILCLSLHEYSFSLDNNRNAPWVDGWPAVFETPALTVSHVCSRWRNIANSCSRLWSSISVQLTARPRVDPMPLLETYLRRSKTHLLSLSLSLDPDEGHTLYGDLTWKQKMAWKLLGSQFGRCRELAIGFDSTDEMPHLEGIELPNLISYRHLAHSSFVPQSLVQQTDQPGWFWPYVLSAPKLIDLTLEDFLPLSWLPYRQLTSMTIRHIHDIDSVEGLFHLLPSCIALTELTLGAWEVPDEPIGPIPPILQHPVEVSSLRCLSLEGTDASDIGMDNILVAVCLPKLSLPGLTTFNVNGWTSVSSDFLQRCSRTLEKLSIDLPGLDDEDDSIHIDSVLSTLPVLSKLTHVELAIKRESYHVFLTPAINHFFTTFLSKLKAESDSGSDSERHVFLPNLQSAHLTLSDMEMSTENVEAVLDAISSRSGRTTTTTCRLTRMHLTRHLPYEFGRGPAQAVIDANALERVRLIRNEGIMVAFDEV
ncbi:hypothetical protein PQX77_014325 [Marasmius sp. AFHP31]|nr:hypothetical protein PQX77_014325 [Marasmius sp. AFHP31]